VVADVDDELGRKVDEDGLEDGLEDGRGGGELLGVLWMVVDELVWEELDVEGGGRGELDGGTLADARLDEGDTDSETDAVPLVLASSRGARRRP
jgi:hypothetical protein